ncbi:biotin-dependent carboxyltransferase family protein [Lutimaribacter marinistellae]|uniref:Biotin-dependent carboxyltransferase family protein n=1 Tax=Lutimaribacter marinistellae TaxID=1820329 RepID=A0ABV7TFV5_9RHOB
MSLHVHRIGPACTVQDLGRTGYLDHGLSRAGAVDLFALHEGAALLGQDPMLAALEMAGMGGEFEAQADMVVALTGARMQASIDGTPVAWNASHGLAKGQRLSIGAVQQGVYGYLHVAGGIATQPFLDSRSSHLVAGIGSPVEAGQTLPVGGGKAKPGMTLTVEDRFSGGTLRVVESFQSALFDGDIRARFAATVFRRSQRANRMGVKLDSEGEGFAARGQLNVLSEVIAIGDIQMTGTGEPFILLPECQTTGGYPRIATVIPCDLARAAQCPAGAEIRFRFLRLDEAVAAQRQAEAELARLPGQVAPLVRDPAGMADLLSYQLIGGVVSATDEGEK